MIFVLIDFFRADYKRYLRLRDKADEIERSVKESRNRQKRLGKTHYDDETNS